jgi:hypothetical protein
MPERASPGRPQFAPTAELRRLVETLAGYGIPQDDICRLVTDAYGKALSHTTLRKHFRGELDTGAVKANAKVAESLFKQATGSGRSAVTAAIFWLKTRAQWKETTVLEHAGKDGEPIKHEIVERIESRLARLAAANAATEDISGSDG